MLDGVDCVDGAACVDGVDGVDGEDGLKELKQSVEDCGPSS